MPSAAPSFILPSGRALGPGHPCFIIAEAGVNHNGDLDMAFKLVDAAVEAGVDAVKFQTFKAGLLVTAHAPMAEYQKTNTGKDESQMAMLKKLEMPDDWHHALVAHCASRQILFISTPFDEISIDFLHTLDLPFFKVPSGELTNLPYLARIAHLGRPLILSTGMATLGEVEAALSCLAMHGNPPVILLHCVSTYPAEASDANLRAMETLRVSFGVPVGYSDHTLGIEVPIAAAALGACVIEKHLTLDCSLPGPDHRASLDPVG
ncbi:MAG: N-acetylneuraminate synthase family protein, partial [Verrucomicrobiaceae bacterium]